jgi:23S rRNA (uridine2552-2'-O)-methyltransferase
MSPPPGKSSPFRRSPDPGFTVFARVFAGRGLKPNGADLIKMSQGAGFQWWIESGRKSFNQVRFARPDASGARSSELYLLASGFRMV